MPPHFVFDCLSRSTPVRLLLGTPPIADCHAIFLGDAVSPLRHELFHLLQYLHVLDLVAIAHFLLDGFSHCQLLSHLLALCIFSLHQYELWKGEAGVVLFASEIFSLLVLLDFLIHSAV